jgi:putative transposase
VKLTAKVKLLCTLEQASALKKTLETANEACNHISGEAWKHKTFQQFPLHNLAYYAARQRYPLSAQVVVRCISRVADAYKTGCQGRRLFKPHSSIAFDERILSWRMSDSTVSLWSVDGRQRIPFACGERQRRLLQGQRGESDLCLIAGTFYLFATCEVETPAPVEVSDVLGGRPRDREPRRR